MMNQDPSNSSKSKTSEGFLNSMLNKLKLRSQRRKFTFSIMVIGLDNCGKTSLVESISGLSKQDGNIQSDQIGPRSTPDLTSGQCRPTVGYNFESIQYNNWISFNVLDFSGNSKYRDLWQEYYCGVDAIVFVIDSSDPIRFVVARDELDTMLCNPFFNSLKMIENNDLQQSSIKTEIRMNNNELLTDLRNPRVEPQKILRIHNGRLIESPLDTSGKPGQLRKLRSRIPILFIANKCDLSNSVDATSITKILNFSRLDTKRHPWHIQSTSIITGEGLNDAFNWLIDILSQTA